MEEAQVIHQILPINTKRTHEIKASDVCIYFISIPTLFVSLGRSHRGGHALVELLNSQCLPSTAYPIAGQASADLGIRDQTKEQI